MSTAVWEELASKPGMQQLSEPLPWRFDVTEIWLCLVNKGTPRSPARVPAALSLVFAIPLVAAVPVRSLRAAFCYQLVGGGTTYKVSMVEIIRPPMAAIENGFCNSVPSPAAIASGPALRS